MKWTLRPDKKLQNCKGEIFKGKVSKDFEPGDQYEEVDDDGKKRLQTVIEKQVSEVGLIVIVMKDEGVVNG